MTLTKTQIFHRTESLSGLRAPDWAGEGRGICA